MLGDLQKEITSDGIWHNNIAQHLISRNLLSQDSQTFHITDGIDHLWCDAKPGVGTAGIYVGNHCNRCREFCIIIEFDQRNIGEKMSLPWLREDPPISECCALEESASHFWFQEAKLQRNLRILSELWRISLISARNQNLRWTQLESSPILLTWEHATSNRNQQKSRILKMSPDTYGHFLVCQESPGMVFDTTRH